MSDRRLSEILVEESRSELILLLRWFSRFGPMPTIIGGWAVYFYNSYFGSTDIDVVGPNHQGTFRDIVERYERTHGYDFTSKDMPGLEVTSRKPVVRDEQIVGYVEIDACTFEDPAPASFHEDANKKLPYSLAAEKRFQREVRLEEDAVCYIPSKRLLLLYKIKAARDRTYDLKTRGTVIDMAKLEWLRGKLTKDRSDVLAILDPNPRRSIVEERFDADAFQDLVRRLKLEFTLTTITELPRYRDSIGLYDPTLEEKQIREWVRTVTR